MFKRGFHDLLWAKHFPIYTPQLKSWVSPLRSTPMKMERIESSETSALKAQTPGDYPKTQYGKVMVVPLHTKQAQREVSYRTKHTRPRPQKAKSGQRHAPAALLAGKRTSTHWTGGWTGLGAALNGSGKCRLHRGSEPRTVQPVANRYTSNYRAGEPYWGLVPKRSINFEEILSRTHHSFEEQMRSWSFP